MTKSNIIVFILALAGIRLLAELERVAFTGQQLPVHHFALPTLAAVLIVLSALIVLRSLKSLVLQATPSTLEFRPAHVDEFPMLDRQTLNKYTDDLVELGFEPVIDYTVDLQPATNIRGFARLFAHPEHHCYAEVNQPFIADAKSLPVRYVIGSSLDQGWSLSSTNRQPDGFMYMMRRPRCLWMSEPDGDPTELLQSHLARRGDILQSLGLGIKAGITAESYFANELEDALDRRSVVQQKNILVGLAEALFFSLKPVYEWMGEYGASAARRPCH